MAKYSKGALSNEEKRRLDAKYYLYDFRNLKQSKQFIPNVIRISQLESELEDEQATYEILVESHRKTQASLEVTTSELSQERGQVHFFLYMSTIFAQPI